MKCEEQISLLSKAHEVAFEFSQSLAEFDTIFDEGSLDISRDVLDTYRVETFDKEPADLLGKHYYS